MFAHLTDMGVASRLNQHLVAGTVHLHLERPTKYLATDILRGHCIFGQQQAAINLRQRRQPGQRLQLIVLESIVTAHLGIQRMPQRYVEFQIEAAITDRLHAVGKAIYLFGHRTFLDEPEKLAGRPLRQTTHQQHFFVRLEIGNIDLDAGQGGTEDAALAGQNTHPGTKTHVRVDVIDDRPTICVVNFGTCRLGGDNELAPLAVTKREILQISLENQFSVVATPGHNAAPKPVAGGRIDRMWHIAPDRTPFAAINCGRQINFSRPVAGKTIGSLSRTRSIRPGELQFIELDVDRLRRRFPACLGL